MRPKNHSVWLARRRCIWSANSLWCFLRLFCFLTSCSYFFCYCCVFCPPAIVFYVINNQHGTRVLLILLYVIPFCIAPLVLAAYRRRWLGAIRLPRCRSTPRPTSPSPRYVRCHHASILMSTPCSLRVVHRRGGGREARCKT